LEGALYASEYSGFPPHAFAGAGSAREWQGKNLSDYSAGAEVQAQIKGAVAELCEGVFGDGCAGLRDV
jgi:hypothetical protein